MTNQEIMQIALQQSAYDCNCTAEDFLKEKPVLVISQSDERARKYLKLPFSCQMVSYGNNVVASVQESVAPIAKSYLDSYPAEHCFETPHLHILNDALRAHGLRICFMAEYFLPDVTKLVERACDYELKLLEPRDFADLYVPQWSNALCEKRKELDVMAVGAYDGSNLIGLAGASADCEMMYQIGVDVLPSYRRRGIASALTSRLAIETLKLGKVPFYCAAWCNLKSVRNATGCGFYPAWVEMTAKEIPFVEQMNDSLAASVESTD